jgi:hypothetical protein
MWKLEGGMLVVFSESCPPFLSLFEDERRSLFSVSMIGNPWVLFSDAEPLSVATFDFEDLASGRDV